MNKNNEISVIYKEGNSSGGRLCRIIFAILFNTFFAIEVFFPVRQYLVLGIIVLTGAGVSVFMQTLSQKRCFRITFIATGIVCTIIIIRFFSKLWVNGATMMLNEIIDSWNKKNGTIFYLYVTNNVNEQASILIFSLTMGIACTVLINLLLLLRWYSTIILINFVFYSFYMLTGSNVHTYYVTVGMLVLMLAYITTIDTENIVIRHSGLYWVIVSVFLVAVTSGIFIVMTFIPDRTIENIREKIVKQIETRTYGSTDLSDGDLNHVKNPVESDIVRLSVTTDSTDVIYLKGYVGAAYRGDSWSDLNKEAYQDKNKDMQQYLIDNKYSPQMMLSMFFSISDSFDNETYDVEERSYSVENISACTKYIYTPYTVQRGSFAYYDNLNRDLNVRNSFVEPKRDYKFKCLEIGVSEYPNLYNNGCLTDGNALKVNEKYLNYEQVYHEYADKYYMDIPDDLRSYFDQHLTQKKLKGAADITDYIRQYLKESITYMDVPERNYSGQDDFIIELLEKNKQGHSVHYATVATMLFRYYGIPARYAEGYRGEATGSDIRNLYAKDAHAWVEIYRYGMGWVPIDVTPGYYSDGQEAVPPKIEETPLPPQVQTPSESDTTDEDEPLPEQEDVSQPSVYIILFSILILVVLILLVIMVRRQIILRRQRKRIQGEDWKDSILFMAGLMWRLCDKGGMHIDNTRLEDYSENMNKMFRQEAKMDFVKILDILNRVKYSDDQKDENDYLIIKAYMDVVRTHIYNNLNWKEKLKLKYIEVC